MQPNPSSPVANLDDPNLYINRELSWLQFNRRVLEEAQDSAVPLLERLKFLAIFASNLDEFYMVRVGGLQQKVTAGIPHGSGADRMSPHMQLERIGQSVREMVSQQYECLMREVMPALDARGIVIRRAADLTGNDLRYVRELFQREIFPVLTPLATDPAHPFPHLLNKSLNLAVALRRPGEPDPLYAVVQVPGVLPRFVQLPSSEPNAQRAARTAVRPRAARRSHPVAFEGPVPRHGPRPGRLLPRHPRQRIRNRRRRRRRFTARDRGPGAGPRAATPSASRSKPVRRRTSSSSSPMPSI